MKFAKELDDNAIPEWKGNYLDYKQAKKKLKAVRKAVRSFPAATVPKPTPGGNSLRDAPVTSLLRNPKQRASAGTEAPSAAGGLTHIRSFSDSFQSSNPRPSASNASQLAPNADEVNERSPLRPTGQTQNARPDERQRMTSYGSIIGSPPHSEHTLRARTYGAPSVELPPPAVSGNRTENEEEDDENDEDDEDDEDEDDDFDENATMSPTTPTSPTIPEPSANPPTRSNTRTANLQSPSISNWHTGNAYEIRPPTDTPANRSLATSRLRALFPKRTNSTPNARPFMRRIFTSSGTSQRAHDDNDVALEVYRELDFREAEFFLFLDKELMKVEKFYRTKEDEAKDRLEIIREHLHIMRNYRLAEILESQEGRDRNHQTESNGRGHSPSMNGDQANGRTGERKRDIITRPLTKSIDFASGALDKVRTGHIGNTSKAMGDLGTPEMAGSHWVPTQNQRDYARREPGDVPYRVAKRKMKMALAEFYRGLELLKSYAMLNRTAFRKINKKYDKTVDAKPPLQYMDQKVNKAHFVTSNEIEITMATVEDLYARYFERGNRKVAVSKLRTKTSKAGDYTGPVARTCAFLGAGVVFGVQGLTKGVVILYDAQGPIHTYTTYLLQLYAGYFLMLLLTFLFCGCAGIFNEFRVNYQFVFELDNRQALNWLQLTEIPALFFFIMGITMWLNFDIQAGGQTMFIYWIVVLVGITVALFFLPAPTFYHKARVWFIYTIWRLLFAGLYPVEFRDFFTGDMFCSLTYSIGNLSTFFCLFAGNWNTPAVCNSSHSRLLGFLTTLPGIWRAAQCLRRFWDTGSWFPHMANFGKYIFTILQYMTLSMYRINQNPQMKALFITMATINSIYCIIWDIFMDWSLGDFDKHTKHKGLRTILAYRKHLWMYYIAIIIDPIIRFNWIFYAIYTSDSQHSSVVSFGVALTEVLRRGMWTLFRVENEHCTNIENAKAYRELPLPYKLRGEESEEHLIPSPTSEAADEDQGPRPLELDPRDVPGDIIPGQSPYTSQPKKAGDRRGLVPTDEISNMDLNKKQGHTQNGKDTPEPGTPRTFQTPGRRASRSDENKPSPYKPGHSLAQQSSHSTKSASGRDIDLERQQSNQSSTLRFRRQACSNGGEGGGSPLANAVSKVTHTMRAAHKFDYIKRKPQAVMSNQASDSEDDDDADDSDREQ